MTFEQEIARMKALRDSIPARIAEISHDGTEEAIKAAAAATPPTGDDLAGTNTRAGGLKAQWEQNSVVDPVKSGNVYETFLKNNLDYASYVNDGHRMHRHFVPGLYVDVYSGLLEYNPKMDVGIMVGTQTTYVPGLYMCEAGEKAFDEYTDAELKKLAEELK